MSNGKRLWGGRFSRGPAPAAAAYSSSLSMDRRLADCDVRGSIAHARMLARAGIIGETEAGLVVGGLEKIAAELARGVFVFEASDEDIHTAVERRLYELVGPPAGRLHTGRSRNDQVALDEKLYLRDFCDRFDAELARLQRALLSLAEKNHPVVMPGYTHLQHAQPILFSHWGLAYLEMFQRDRDRVSGARARVNVSPLGAGAGAGSSLPLDPEYSAGLLGFDRVFANSLDAVSDRDCLVELVMAMSLAAMHLSRLCEELVLWSSREFDFIRIDQRYCTGSSALPQKQNPDMAELARARSGTVFGSLVALLTILKGLPLSYNRDLQEDKAPFFAAEDALLPSLSVVAALLPGTVLNRRAMKEAAESGFAVAIDLAEFLVRRGLPFREAHGVVGRLVKDCLRQKRKPADLTLARLRSFSPLFDREALGLLSLRASLEQRCTPGSPNPALVARALAGWRRRLDGETAGEASPADSPNRVKRSCRQKTPAQGSMKIPRAER